MARQAVNWIQLEPPDFSNQPWGDPSSTDPVYDRAIQIHSRGFGGPSTKYVDQSAPTTTWTDFNET